MTPFADRIAARVRVIKNAVVQGRGPGAALLKDMDAGFWIQYHQVAPYTMTSPERLFAVREAIHHIARAAIPGDVVECGVWRGGSSMMAALAMKETGDRRRLWLYDTFEGMTEPGELDREVGGQDARMQYTRAVSRHGTWAKATIKDVRSNLAALGYDEELITLVQGRVEDTIPDAAPDQISLLRLDTDWYESTRHELEHLWPRLATGGILIVDDYGHFEGARKAVDEYFEAAGGAPLLARVDYAARIAVKV